MQRIFFPTVVAASALFVSGSACAQWGFTGTPAMCDLVVIGTLSDLDGGVALAGGAVYDTTLGTIEVERVVYGREGAVLPSKVRLHSAQLAGLVCPRISHEVHLHQRGAWMLDDTGIEGVYSAIRPDPVLEPGSLGEETPRVRFARAVLDAELGIVEVQVRYENFSPRPATFPAGLTVVVEGRGGWGDEPEVRAIEATTGAVSVSPWRFEEATVRVALPRLLQGLEILDVHPSLDARGRVHGCSVESAQAGESGCGPPLWIAPDARTSLSLAYPPPVFLILAACVGGLPLTTRGRSWRWRQRAEQLGTFLVTGALSLLPWSVLGFFSWVQLLMGLQAHYPLMLSALAFHALVVGALWCGVKTPCRKGVVVGALSPPLLLAGTYGLSMACTLP